MNAIVTVIGKDRVGIIAAVCIKLAEMNINVLDISQTIMQGKFTMIMAVDVSEATVSFAEVRDALAELGGRWNSPFASSGKRFSTPCIPSEVTDHDESEGYTFHH